MRIVSVNIGQPAIIVRGGRQYASSINRRPVLGSVGLTTSGLIGDHPTDGLHHGGPDRAVSAYPHEHYVFWEQRLGTVLTLPSFGENLTTTGLLESQVCIGDTFRIGRAVLQISQPRQPCWKLADKHSEPDLGRWIVETGYTGFHFRVLQPGRINTSDDVHLVDRPHTDLTVLLAVQTALAQSPPREVLDCFANLPTLSVPWRARMAKKLAALENQP